MATVIREAEERKFEGPRIFTGSKGLGSIDVGQGVAEGSNESSSQTSQLQMSRNNIPIIINEPGYTSEEEKFRIKFPQPRKRSITFSDEKRDEITDKGKLRRPSIVRTNEELRTRTSINLNTGRRQSITEDNHNSIETDEEESRRRMQPRRSLEGSAEECGLSSVEENDEYVARSIRTSVIQQQRRRSFGFETDPTEEVTPPTSGLKIEESKLANVVSKNRMKESLRGESISEERSIRTP
jgi:hypothetical protein